MELQVLQHRPTNDDLNSSLSTSSNRLETQDSRLKTRVKNGGGMVVVTTTTMIMDLRQN